MVPCGAGASDIRGDPVCQRAERPERDPGSLADASGHPDRPGHRDRVSIHGRVASRAPAPGSPRCGGCPMTTSPSCWSTQPRQWHGSGRAVGLLERSEEHTSELQSLMRISYAVFCLKKKKKK